MLFFFITNLTFSSPILSGEIWSLDSVESKIILGDEKGGDQSEDRPNKRKSEETEEETPTKKMQMIPYGDKGTGKTTKQGKEEKVGKAGKKTVGRKESKESKVEKKPLKKSEKKPETHVELEGVLRPANKLTSSERYKHLTDCTLQKVTEWFDNAEMNGPTNLRPSVLKAFHEWCKMVQTASLRK